MLILHCFLVFCTQRRKLNKHYLLGVIFFPLTLITINHIRYDATYPKDDNDKKYNISSTVLCPCCWWRWSRTIWNYTERKKNISIRNVNYSTGVNWFVWFSFNLESLQQRMHWHQHWLLKLDLLFNLHLSWICTCLSQNVSHSTTYHRSYSHTLVWQVWMKHSLYLCWRCR